MNDFYKTAMGRKFYETDVPKLISVLEKISHSMAESNKLKERQFRLQEKLMKGELKELSEKVKSTTAEKRKLK